MLYQKGQNKIKTKKMEIGEIPKELIDKVDECKTNDNGSCG